MVTGTPTGSPAARMIFPERGVEWNWYDLDWDELN